MDRRAALADHDSVVLRQKRRRGWPRLLIGIVLIAVAVVVYLPTAGDEAQAGQRYDPATPFGVTLAFGVFFLVGGARRLMAGHGPLYLFDRDGLVSLRPPAVHGWDEVTRVRVGESSGLRVELGKDNVLISGTPAEFGRETDELRAAIKSLRDRHRDNAERFGPRNG
jgi:hypothetical protein